ncbi:MAG: hypothetical protein IJQ98_02820, partial [Oscillospiraceae bacterium]|nr:hypothetical protein [Oscillospiraceae bacterium]
AIFCLSNLPGIGSSLADTRFPASSSGGKERRKTCFIPILHRPWCGVFAVRGTRAAAANEQ